MGLMKKIKNIRDNYVKNQVKKAVIPEFCAKDKVRHHYIFSGRVQHVGFRLEVEQLAKRLGLTGWIKNCDNGNVELEIQGPKERIEYLVEFMSSLVRIRIKDCRMNEVNVIEIEQVFLIL